MRRKHLLTIITMAAFIIFFVNLSHALVGIEVDPPSQSVNSPVNITIVVAVGDDAPSAMKCNVLVRFGDGRSWINSGKCEVSSGACMIRTTHTYGSTGKYKIEARSDRCSYKIGPAVSTNVSIFPARPIQPQPRKRPGY